MPALVLIPAPVRTETASASRMHPPTTATRSMSSSSGGVILVLRVLDRDPECVFGSEELAHDRGHSRGQALTEQLAAGFRHADLEPEQDLSAEAGRRLEAGGAEEVTQF